jgi:large subunit ribosomal protein L31
MKKQIHPKYQKVLFVDTATGYRFICGTTLQPQGTEVFEGVEYPVFHLTISSASHPFFTGSTQLLDAEGRVEKFRNRYKTAQEKQAKRNEEDSAAIVAAAAPKKATARKAKGA